MSARSAIAGSTPSPPRLRVPERIPDLKRPADMNAFETQGRFTKSRYGEERIDS